MEKYNRTRGELEVLPLISGHTIQTTTRKNASPIVVTTPYSFDLFGSNGKVMHDVVTPSYKKLSSDGKIVNNPMTIIEESCSYIPRNGSHALYTRTGYAPNGTNIRVETVLYNMLAPSLMPEGSPFAGPLPDVSQTAINDAISASHQRNVMGIVDLLEGHKTVALLRENIRRLDSILKGIPLRKLGRAKSSRNGKVLFSKYKPNTVAGRAADAAGLHLEIQYGVIPLMMTIEGLMKTFTDASPPIRQTFRGSSSDDDRTVDTTYSDIIGPYTGNVIGKAEVIKIRERETYARAGVLTEYRPPLQGQLGLELRDIPTAAYELMKFSFVLDWWYDLGSFIEAAIPVPGYSQLASWSTVVHKEVVSHTLFSPYARETGPTEGTSPNTYVREWTWFANQAGVSWTRETKVRTPNISVGAPKLDLNFRSFTHAVSALALAITLGKSSLTRRI